MNASQQRLSRLLAMVPYLEERPGVPVAEAAGDFGVSDAQFREDLNLLFVCGLPGYGPGDLIDMTLDEETVTLTFDAGVSRPLRLTSDEAIALIVALRTLADTPGLRDLEVVQRALSKLESAAGDAAGDADRVTVAPSPSAETGLRTALRDVVARGRAVWLRYYTATREQTTTRTVDPIRVLVVEDHAYLEAWCRDAQGVRRFRLDRIDEWRELQEPSRPPQQARDPAEQRSFAATAEQPRIELQLGPAARWVSEYYPHERLTDTPDGGMRVVMPVADMGWALRLVLGLGAQAQVVSPPELAGRVRQQARLALAAYEATETTEAPVGNEQ